MYVGVCVCLFIFSTVSLALNAVPTIAVRVRTAQCAKVCPVAPHLCVTVCLCVESTNAGAVAGAHAPRWFMAHCCGAALA